MPKTNPYKIGDKVTYVAAHAKPEKGIVKQVREERPDAAWVVYNCGNNWDRFKEYTGCMTNVRDLVVGWPDEE